MQVTANSPAAAAVLQPGDVILSINSQPLDDSNPLTNVLTHLTAGALVPVTIVRDGQQQEVPVTLGSR